MSGSQSSSGPKIVTLDESDNTRFWAKVQTATSPEDCWPWLGAVDGYGYGLFSLKGATRRTHRLMYEIAKGEIPAGAVLLHKCDNPPCVRPSHLKPGTRADNNADRDAKGRHWSPGGEAHHAAKLTEADVRAIRNAPRGYGKTRALAETYGVSTQTIYRVWDRSNWKQVSA